MNNSVSVCLSIYNQENIIERILFGILNNASINVKEFIVLLDGCTDRTEQIVHKILSDIHQFNCKILESNDVWETKANNITFKESTCDYIVTVQDDMIVKEKDFDQRLLKPFGAMDNILGVTARNTQNERINGERLNCYDVAGKDVNTPRDLFCVRQVIVRGPVIFNHEKLKSLNYLDETFAPIYADEKDLCFRAYRKGWLVGAYVIDYDSPDAWGKTRTNPPDKQEFWWQSVFKNEKLIIARHSDLLNSDPHNMDIVIE